MLSKVCIFDILNNSHLTNNNYLRVVNCFQKFVSLIFWTTMKTIKNMTMSLWIAFKSLYLWYSEQQPAFKIKDIIGCELLSKVCIFDILNNNTATADPTKPVVNCFQKFVSLIFWTTFTFRRLKRNSCELLSKVCIFDILNNSW